MRAEIPGVAENRARLEKLEERLGALESRMNGLSAHGSPSEGDLKHPMQPVYLDDRGTARFKQNAIVRFLLDAGPFDMNKIAVLPGISQEDREQFAQLIGYSISGFGELSYVSSKAYHRADAMIDGLLEEKE